MRIYVFAVLIIAAVLETALATTALDAPWATSLSYSSGVFWRERVPVHITAGDTPLVGMPVVVELPPLSADMQRHLRVVRHDGREVLFGLDDAANSTTNSVTRLVLPVDAVAGETVRYDIYCNPYPQRCVLPIPPAEYLAASPELRNGGFETAAQAAANTTVTNPAWWEFDASDETHAITWDTEAQHSGACAIKTVVAENAAASWIAARQRGLVVVPGGRYRLTGFVRGERVRGIVGWYIHLIPEGRSFSASPMATTRDENFNWRELSVEFTVPPEATRADVGTVLHGTGTAWFDDVRLECLDADSDKQISVAVSPLERAPWTLLPAASIPEGDIAPDGEGCITFRLVNPSSNAMERTSVLFDLRASAAHGRIATPSDIRVVTPDGSTTPARLIDSTHRLATATLSVPPQSVMMVNVFYQMREVSEISGTSAISTSTSTSHEGTAHPELQMRAMVSDDPPNLLTNGDFEADDAATGWRGASDIEIDRDIVRFGERCARLAMTDADVETWRGFVQTVPVTPGHSYLVSGFLRCLDMPSGARIHIHFYQPSGEVSTVLGMTSVDQEIRGTTDWTHCSQLFTAPPDAATMTIHLTANNTGTLWHDNIAIRDSLRAEFAEVKAVFPTTPITPQPQLHVWQLPAVMKPFPESLPPAMNTAVLHLSAARNESEPLQVALRFSDASAQIQTSLTLRVTPLSSTTDNNSSTLPPPEIALVANVPVDTPSNYYTDRSPRWYRKVATTASGCDGWTGRFPDPLVPTDTLRLTKETRSDTHAFWITWSVPRDAAAGCYRGTLSIVTDDDASRNTLATLPTLIELPIEFTVYDFTLSDDNGISATYDARFTGTPSPWSKDIYRDGVAMMASRRLEPDAIQPELRFTWHDGACQVDWTAFDAAAERLFAQADVRFLYTPEFFYCFGWGHPPRSVFGEEPFEGESPFTDADRTRLRPAYKERYQAALREFWNHVTERGWSHRFVLYISDEPNFWEKPIEHQMISLCAMIHEVDPAIPIYCSTWHDVPAWHNALDVWGVGHYGIVPPEKLAALRQRGKRLWFTTDGMMCLDTPYAAIERLLPHYCFKSGAEAYEFWGVGWLTHNPWQYGFHSFIHQSSTPGDFYWVRYPNGDGYLLYPPLSDTAENNTICSSIRLEQAREGVEDFLYLTMLRDLTFSATTEETKISKAKAVLAEATALVDSPCEIGRYSTRILPDPRRLETLRQKIAAAIESLQ